jgi:8-oxo-dGTP diphosphatase
MSTITDEEKQSEYEKVIDKEIAKFDVNPFVIDSDNNIIMAKRITTVQFGGTWHMPGGKVFKDERIDNALKRMTLLKTGLQIEFLYPTLNESVVGVYDDPKRDPREHVLGITFFCKVVGGEIKVGGNCSDVKAFTPTEALELELAFGHDYMIKDAIRILTNNGVLN